MKIQEREKACFEVLEKLPLDNYVLIGGYATSSFEFPRFSVDLDLVIEKKNKETFIRILSKEDFSQTTETENLDKFYKGQSLRFEKKIDNFPVSVDLMIDAVVSRQTNVSYKFSYLFKNSTLREVVGSTLDFQVNARVATREILIALKLSSLRLSDIRDIIALCFGEIDKERLKKHLQRCPGDKIKENIHTALQVLRDERHKDSIKGVFSLSDSTYEKITGKAEKVLKALV